MRSFRDFARSAYVPELDGLRAVSIVLVLVAHSRLDVLRPLHGYTGVTIFFVISGFLITTLLLREGETRPGGMPSFAGFYVRRGFRILPLYYVALAVFTLAVGIGLGEAPGDYRHRLVYFLTYTNEFASPGTFGHSWSLAIEEKFYLVWPLLAFGIPVLARRRLGLTVALVAATSTVGLVWPTHGYLGTYAPIAAGCLVAVVMHTEQGYEQAARLATPLVGPVLVAVAVATMLLSPDELHVQVPVGLAVAVAFPALLVGPPWLRAALLTAPNRWIGRRAYGIYLFHPLVGSAVDVVVSPGDSIALQIVNFLLTAAGSFIVADLLHRWFERPLIAIGQRLTGKGATAPDSGGPAESDRSGLA